MVISQVSERNDKPPGPAQPYSPAAATQTGAVLLLMGVSSQDAWPAAQGPDIDQASEGSN